MSRLSKVRGAAVAAGSAAIMATGAAAASATSLNGSGGTALAAGATLSAPLNGSTTGGMASLSTWFGPSTCSTGIAGGTLGSPNPNPGMAVSLSSPVFTLGSCSGPTSGAFRIFSAALSSATNVRAETPSTAAGYDGDLVIGSGTVSVSIGVPRTSPVPNGTCLMTVANARGRLLNSNNSVTFSAVPIASATGVCAQALPATFDAMFRPVKSGGAPVTISPTP